MWHEKMVLYLNNFVGSLSYIRAKRRPLSTYNLVK